MSKTNNALQSICNHKDISWKTPDAHIKTAALAQTAAQQETCQGVAMYICDLLINCILFFLNCIGDMPER